MHGCTFDFFTPARVPVLRLFASSTEGSPAPGLRACMVALSTSLRRHACRFCVCSPRPPRGVRPLGYVHAWLHFRLLYAGTRAGFAFVRLVHRGESSPWATMHGCTFDFFTPAACRFCVCSPRPPGPWATCMHGCTFDFFTPARVPVLRLFASSTEGSPAPGLRACMVALSTSLRRHACRFCVCSPRPPRGVRPLGYVHAWLHFRLLYAGTRAGFAFVRLVHRGENTTTKANTVPSMKSPGIQRPTSPPGP